MPDLLRSIALCNISLICIPFRYASCCALVLCRYRNWSSSTNAIPGSTSQFCLTSASSSDTWLCCSSPSLKTTSSSPDLNNLWPQKRTSDINCLTSLTFYYGLTFKQQRVLMTDHVTLMLYRYLIPTYTCNSLTFTWDSVLEMENFTKRNAV